MLAFLGLFHPARKLYELMLFLVEIEGGSLQTGCV
jgi:hypothetical protein